MLTSPDGLRIWECMMSGVIKPSKLFVLIPNKNNIITFQFSSVFTKRIVENPLPIRYFPTWVQWLEDMGFMNRSESPTASLVQVRSPQAWSFQLAALLQRTQHVEPSWARGSLVCRRHGKGRWWSLCSPDSATKSQNSRQLCLFFWIFLESRAIGAVRWNEPLYQRWAAVWRSVHSWLLFGCQGRASWNSRSGTIFQCWHNSRQCPGIINLKIGPPLTIRAQLRDFR